MIISTGRERWIFPTTSWKSVISPKTTCAIGCRRPGASVAEFLLDTDAASRLMRAERSAITNMRQSGAKTLSISSVTMAELVYGARLREDNPSVMSAVRAFLARILIHPWDEAAAEAHARIRILAKRLGRSAGAFDIMIAAHADALGVTLVTKDAAIKNLAIDGLKIISW
jgi:tRNA(fMet)-specific endonuclease VapC